VDYALCNDDRPTRRSIRRPIDDVELGLQCRTSAVGRRSDRNAKWPGQHVAHEVGNTWRPRPNKNNDYLIDRVAQKEWRTYSGIAGFAMQVSGIQDLIGPIVDRTKENLAATDNGIMANIA
jgi:hypothetical protein